MHRKALIIHEKLRYQEGIAVENARLGIVYEARGELDTAIEMRRMAAAIIKKLTRRKVKGSSSKNRSA
jgi:hypothetical protein